MTDRTDREPAFVLHRRAFRETSLLLELLTRGHGRVTVVARGARRARGNAGSVYQPLQPLLVSWTGRSELKTLIAGERAGSNPEIRGRGLYSALYLNEILVRLLPHQDPHPRLFDAYACVLPRLAVSEDIEPDLRSFELLLLRELGYGLELGSLGSDGRVLEPEARYLFEPRQGLVEAVSAEDDRAYPGWVLKAMEEGDFSNPETRRCAKRLLRGIISGLLGEKPLMSREYFRAGS